MIEVKKIKKSFGNKEVLKGIDAKFEPGVVNMTLGQSGSGKTVLLKCIVGLLNPTFGEIFFSGQNFTKMNYIQKKNLRRTIGMLFQGSALFTSLSVQENIAFPLKIFTNKTEKEILKRVDFCLCRVNLEGINKLFPGELSGGMMKRVGIARAIALNPKYMFYDEPNSGLDPKTASVIDELIRELTIEFNTTTIINTHDMNSVFGIGDKVIYIHKGSKWWEGTPKDIDKSDNKELLELVYSGNFYKRILKDEN